MGLSNFFKMALIISAVLPATGGAWAQDITMDSGISKVGVDGDTIDPAQMRPLDSTEEQDGLRALLTQCVRSAALHLGVKGSFVENPEVRLSIPKEYFRGDVFLLETHSNKPATDFELRINRVAEGVIPKVAGLFLVAVRQMRGRDVIAVAASESDTAATLQLHHRMAKGLIEVVRPVIQDAMSDYGFESVYAVKPAEVSVNDASVPFDVENFLIEKVLESFFVSMSEEEKALRAKTSTCDEKITCWYLAGEMPRE
jgi:hypothetical protein